MSYLDKFPPNRFLKRYMTPGRTILMVLGLMALELVGAKCFPHVLGIGAMYFLMAFLPVMVGMIVWQIVWMIKNPPPPRERCPHCHQLMPEKDDE